MNLVMETFGRAIKPLFGTGVGRLPGVVPIYKYIWRHFGPKGIRLVEANGVKLYINCRDGAIFPSLSFGHIWEPAETGVFKQSVKEGMTIIDAGAHIGYYSLLASRLVGSKGKVYAFEPSPECLGLFHRNIQLNNCKNIQVFEKALTGKSGYTMFYLDRDNLASGSILKVPQSRQRIEVSTITLDEAIGDERVDFIKMDIEGGETKALSGAVKTIENNINLEMMIEVFPERLVGAGSSLKEYVELLQYHFRLYIIRKCGLTGEAGLQDIRKAVRRAGSINLFCRRR